MKTIVLIGNMFSGDAVQDYNYLKKNLDMKKYNLISPISFSEYKDKDQFTLNMLKGAVMLGNMYNEFGTIKSIAPEDKVTIYFGLAHTNVIHSEIYVVNKLLVETQETFLDYFLDKNNIRFTYVHSVNAIKEFKDVKDFAEYINAL